MSNGYYFSVYKVAISINFRDPLPKQKNGWLSLIYVFRIYVHKVRCYRIGLSKVHTGEKVSLRRLQKNRSMLYLGVWFSSSGTTFEEHYKVKRSKINYLVAKTKAWSRQAQDRLQSAQALWDMAVMLLLLYGVEAIDFDDRWRLESGY